MSQNRFISMRNRTLTTLLLLVLLPALIPSVANAMAPAIDAPAALAPLLQQHLGLDDRALTDEGDRQAAIRAVQRRVPELLATEGYFSPETSVAVEGLQLKIKVIPGPRTHISQVKITLNGSLETSRAEQLRADWLLPTGKPFRQEEWDAAKQALLLQLISRDFPEAKLVESHAEIDPKQLQATLSLTYDTGPRVLLGDIRYEGLSRYSRELAERYNDLLKPGKPYREADVLSLQSALQQTPYFSSVSIELLPADEDGGSSERNPPATVTRPVLVQVSEQRPHHVGIGTGYSSNTGARVETSFRTADLFQRGWELQTGLRIEQKRQTAYADIFLPPNKDGSFDSFGINHERSDIQNLITNKSAFGIVRARQQGALETRHSLNWITEKQETDHGEPTTNNALTPNTMWTWRKVDNMTAPRRGFVAMGQVGGGAKAVLSDQDFLRLNGRLQWFLPVGARDVFSIRGELGATLASSRENIPADWLFRTGGAQTVRGYQYQSLGVEEGNAVLGGRYLAIASAEYTHWLNNSWGIAAFVDAGDARDETKGFKLATGAGLGARWKSPAGPIGVDLAYGDRTEEWQLHFSLAIPF